MRVSCRERERERKYSILKNVRESTLFPYNNNFILFLYIFDPILYLT